MNTYVVKKITFAIQKLVTGGTWSAFTSAGEKAHALLNVAYVRDVSNPRMFATKGMFRKNPRRSKTVGITKICPKKSKIIPTFAVVVAKNPDNVINMIGNARKPLLNVFRVVAKKPSPFPGKGILPTDLWDKCIEAFHLPFDSQT